ncbi:MAG: helix-turn-helix domain-containing protein [Chitinivibrionales bacterium]|nr:helix-turn-helix domain-containing protein [Chitinivibrionales bacterium]MBD3394936.1 helix-turn-helix domain-containing protein [Chitinivibrionales bacterium]
MKAFNWDREHGGEVGYHGLLARVVDRTYDTVFNPGKHFHESFELIYVMEGSSRIVMEGEEFTAKAGDLVLFRPEVVHDEYIQPGPFRIMWLLVDPGQLAVPLPDAKDLPVLVNLDFPDRFRTLFEQIVAENERTDRWSKMLVGSYLIQFTVLLQRALERRHEEAENEGDINATRIGNVMMLINTKLDSDISLKELASSAFMSESHFSHVFKDVAGVSPKRYVIRKRMERARELLQTSGKAVSQIAVDLGYDNPKYFSRLFKKEFGVTPGACRKSA